MIIVCPNCNKTHFRTGKSMCAEATVDFENGEFIVNPLTKEQFTISCLSCNEKYDLTNEETVKLLTNPIYKCSECGNDFPINDLDENQICPICRLKKIDESFANLENASSLDIMKALAKARIDNMNLSQKNQKIEEELETANKILNDIKEEEQPKQKRHRRTKAEIEAERLAEQANNTDDNSIDADAEVNTTSDIQISDDVAPDLPPEIEEMSNALEEGVQS